MTVNIWANVASAIWVNASNVVKASVRAYHLETETAVNALYSAAPFPVNAVGGTANAITGTLTETLTGYTSGMAVWLTPTATNTASDPTLNLDGQGAKIIKDSSGAAIPAGTLIISRRHHLVYDGTVFRLMGSETGGDVFKMLFADDTGGQNAATAQPWFPTAGTVTLPASGTYFFDGLLYLSRAAGAVSHTTGVLFGGTATLTAINYLGMAKEGDANDLQDMSAFWATAATTLVLKAASTSVTEQVIIRVQGIVRINGAGTLIPQFIYSAAPGGAPTVKAGSYFSMRKIPDNAVASRGAWA